MITFNKYQGTGNDFILIDGFKGKDSLIDQSQQSIAFLCDRRFGIGADGLIILKEIEGAHFEMIYFNADGNIGSMCGNGSRCAVAFARQLGYISNTCKFIAYDGLHEAEVLLEDKNEFLIKVKMRDVCKPVKYEKDILLDTGSPHYIKVVVDVDKIDVVSEGRAIRYDEHFKADGINVNFICTAIDLLQVRTYERGVEDETLSCGTGVTASAISANFLGLIKTDGYVDVLTMGGQLKVYFKQTSDGYSDIWLQGPAVMVFKGEINK